MATSRIPAFYKKSLAQRQDCLLQQCPDITRNELMALEGQSEALDWSRADKMVENCIGVLSLPLGLALNFTINERDYLIPMAVEEPSIIAAVSHIARLVRPYGGFKAQSDPSIMIAQVQILKLANIEDAVASIHQNKSNLIQQANQFQPNLVQRGGGVKEIETRVLQAENGSLMLIVHFLVDCVDAMGANAVNTIAEGMAQPLSLLTGGQICLRILSNLADHRLARAQVAVKVEALAIANMSGAQVAAGIVAAFQFADIDPYRAATHNKGIMNGIDAVAIATGNDWRGIEAGAHAYACQDGRYRSLTKWWLEEDRLHGSIELPLAAATIGGATGVHPSIKTLRKILDVESARELSLVMATVGLAQNMGALKALASEGIQRGHMNLHARSVALAAGASEHEVSFLAEQLIQSQQIRLGFAQTLLQSMRQ
jgi:hydroxymethylglutaryl-CoA reductase